MNYEVLLRPEAEADITEAYQSYEDKQRDLVRSFFGL